MAEANGWDDDLDALDDGWGEDNDDFFDDDDDANEGSKAELPTASLQPPKPNTDDQHVVEDSASADGWGDDDSLFDDGDSAEGQNEPIIEPPHPAPDNHAGVPSSSLERELSEYISSLPHHASSIKIVLAAEYNTTEKAMELRDYYASRPALLEYTLEKEVPRMDYTVVYAGDVASDKPTVQQMLRDADSICSRCANQSLLADILQVLTGEDRVVRPQHMATAIASQCQFHIDLDASVVQAIATLELSLPTSKGRWKVAEIQVMIVFEPEQVAVDFRVAEIHLAPKDAAWNAMLKDSAALLEMLSAEELLNPSPPVPQAQNFRDRFLQSQNLLQASAAGAVKGFKSAWQDIDAATGFGNKIKNILPDTDALVQQAEDSATNVPPPKHRPTSILGGFVRSLAKSVAIPDEEWEPPQARAPAVEPPKLYNIESKRPTTAANPSTPMPPKLYNRQAEEVPHPTENPLVVDSATRSSWRVNEKVNVPAPQEPSEPLLAPTTADTVIKDGWDELSVADDVMEETESPPDNADSKIRDRKRWINPRANAPRSVVA